MKDWTALVRGVVADYATRKTLLVWGAATLIVAIAGPFGTYAALSIGYRLFYWGGIIAASILIAFCCRLVWRLALGLDYSWVEDILVASSLALVFGPFVSWINDWLWPDVRAVAGWLTVSVITFLVGVTTVSVRRILHSEATQTQNRRDRLLDRIGAPSGARLGRVSSDNHHIVVKLVGGQEMRVLMRLRDAVADIDVEPGFCVHRSHWVALSQIRDIKETEGREVVELPCGSEVPVGPKYRSNLVEAGMVSA